MSLYEKLPIEALVQFHYEIRKNIENGILSEKMNFELELIKAATAKRGVMIIEQCSNKCK
ncbi:hypothetical protein BIV60_20240 [Bacillus sp. MUM 116]|uniref:hypothetical protein n=1 Tax=Bacillus sp. MUM 116 TaxID=1678002 RepID=UPI0008F5CEA1|nr:hypothetical protein [Bacillus sp. MUM 116]OIK10801.1 hypothetical protein BIV60_20240 [Bacillus sp. MUM 116]